MSKPMATPIAPETVVATAIRMEARKGRNNLAGMKTTIIVIAEKNSSKAAEKSGPMIGLVT